jgi:putative membrane protein
MYLWLKAAHVIFMVTWFAGLFYLPRLYVYHAMCTDETSNARFKIMERKLYFGIMTPGAIATVAAGLWLLWLQGTGWLAGAYWLQAKLACVAVLIGYHVYLGILLARFATERNRNGHTFYRWLNEVPVFFLVAIVILAILKPWSS